MYEPKNIPEFQDGSQTQAAYDDLYSFDFREDESGEQEERLLQTEEYFQEFDNECRFRDKVQDRAVDLGYTGTTNEELITFLVHRCRQAEVGLSRQTITNWIRQSAPTGSGRENVYRLCFALSMNERETAEFFLKAFLERPFQFKSVRECIYYYCLKNGLSFTHANALIERVEQSPAQPSPFPDDNTAKIGQEVTSFRSEERLVRYLLENRSGFETRNQTAIREIEDLLDSCCKLAAREKPMLEEDVKRPNKTDAEKLTTDALLQVIYGYAERKTEVDASGMRRKAIPISISKSKFPKAIRENFPRRQQIENILKGKIQDSYDSIRKALIVLKFYSFYGQKCVQKYESHEMDPYEAEGDDTFDEFTDELNGCLYKCGFAQMYWRNPFDWMIGYCAFSGYPLVAFRDLIEWFYLKPAFADPDEEDEEA